MLEESYCNGAGEIGTASFVVQAAAGHVFEIDVTANYTVSFSFNIETVATPPRVRVTTQDRFITLLTLMIQYYTIFINS